jgi:imidazolonepropionase-like amidohydrolase
MSHISATQRLGFSRTQSTSGFAYDDVIRTARASRASITSTLFSATALLAGEDRELVSDARVRRLYTPEQAAELEEFAGEEPDLESLDRDVRVLRDVLRGGGRVLAGTDLPLEPVAVHLHLNLRAMVRGGLTAYEALRTATAEPAEHFGLAGHLGTVRPGRLADLAFVRGDPLRDVEAAADVQMVMTDGRLRRLPALLAPFPER